MAQIYIGTLQDYSAAKDILNEINNDPKSNVQLKIQTALLYIDLKDYTAARKILDKIKNNKNILEKLDISISTAIYQIYKEDFQDDVAGIEILLAIIKKNPTLADYIEYIKAELSRFSDLPNGIEILTTLKTKYPEEFLIIYTFGFY